MPHLSVSIVVPTYNRASLLELALRGVLEHFPDILYVFSDFGFIPHGDRETAWECRHPGSRLTDADEGMRRERKRLGSWAARL